MSEPNEVSDHYFSVDPSTPSDPKSFTFSYHGREISVTTDRGVFSYGSLDLGTRVLLETAPPPPDGTALDMGCGAGPIALALGMYDNARPIYAVDTNTRALSLTRDNAMRNAITGITACLPEEVPTGVMFTTIWSNPPIRIGKEALHELLLAWLPRLNQSGEAWIVVQKNLGADSLQKWLTTIGFSADKIASKKGFRVFRVRHARNG